MKHNIKTNLKLAGVCATAMMTLSGCGNKHPNVVEAISENKLLVKDIKDDKQRIIEIDQKKLKYYRDSINSIKFQKKQGR